MAAATNLKLAVLFNEVFFFFPVCSVMKSVFLHHAASRRGCQSTVTCQRSAASAGTCEMNISLGLELVYPLSWWHI